MRALSEDTHGRRVLLHLLRADGVSKLAPASRSVLQPPPKARSASAGEPPASTAADPSGKASAAADDESDDEAPEQVCYFISTEYYRFQMYRSVFYEACSFNVWLQMFEIGFGATNSQATRVEFLPAVGQGMIGTPSRSVDRFHSSADKAAHLRTDDHRALSLLLVAILLCNSYFYFT